MMRRCIIHPVAGLFIILALAACGPSAAVLEGERNFARLGCVDCHPTSGTECGIGPLLKGVAGTHITLTSGAYVLRDDAYLRRAILEPDAEVVEGYETGVMPLPSQREEPLTPEVVASLVEYIKSLK